MAAKKDPSTPDPVEGQPADNTAGGTRARTRKPEPLLGSAPRGTERARLVAEVERLTAEVKRLSARRRAR